MSFNIGARTMAERAGELENLARIDGALPGETAAGVHFMHRATGSARR